MPYIDDELSKNELASEYFSEPIGRIDRLSHEVASRMFPGARLHDSPNIFYFPFKLCNSFPQINGRGRTFSPKVLQQSFASLNDQLIDFDHLLCDNGSHLDRIIGHVKATSFSAPPVIDMEIAGALYNAVASIKEPIPVHGLAALFLRANGVQEAINNHIKGKQIWSTSMECGHRWQDAYFNYRGEFIPLTDAEVAMRDCIESDRVRPYKGHELSVLLGGLDKQVDFWGVALTTNPADPKATADITHYIGGKNKELSSKKIFFMPLERYTSKELEVASTTVDKKISEIATISIIGETDPAKDGHKHYILSNLKVLPAQDVSGLHHSHFINDANINRGTVSLLTGITDLYISSGNHPMDSGFSIGDKVSVVGEKHSEEHTTGTIREIVGNAFGIQFDGTDEIHKWYIGSELELIGKTQNKTLNEHLHTIRIELKGKYKENKTESDYDTNIDNTDNDTSHEEGSMNEELKKLLANLNTAVAALSASKTDDERKKHDLEIASIQKEIASLNAKQTSEDDKQAYLQEQVKAGKYISKEAADAAAAEAVEAAKKEAEAKHAAELEAEKVRNRRLDEVRQLGINLDTVYEGIKDKDGNDMTFGKRLAAFGTDETGELEYKISLSSWSQLAKHNTQQSSQQTQQKAETTVAEAANNGTNKNVPKISAPKINLAGGGSSETANKTDDKNIPSHLKGRSRLSLAKS